MTAQSYRLGQPYLTTWTPEKVATAPDPALAWCHYAHQVLGVPVPTIKDQSATRAAINRFFDSEPAADYYTLCRLVMWAKNTKRRFKRMPPIVEAWRDAYYKGALPELTPSAVDPQLEARIADALATETRPSWRYRLLTTTGNELRKATFDEWACSP